MMNGKALMLPLLAILLLAGCATGERRTARLDAELSEIIRLFPGRYVGEAPLPPSSEPAPIYHIIDSIYAPQFGEHVFSYQLRRDGSDGVLLQQKIFVFDSAAERTQNLMHAWVFPAELYNPGFATRPAAWLSMPPETLKTFPDDCAFRWRETAEGFSGSVAAERCGFDSKTFGQMVSAAMVYEISPQALIWEETLTDRDGATVASTGKPLQALRTGPVVDVRREFYDVQGSTVMEIRKDLYATSPIVADGEKRDARTEWVVRWDIEWSESSTGCRVGEVATTVDIDYLLPRLADVDSLPSHLVEEWDRYTVALLKHELRHQQFAVNAARKIESMLPVLQERADCTAAADEANRIADNIISSARRRERQYDYTTRHGYADGAEFPRSRSD